MIEDKKQIEFFKKIAELQFMTLVNKDYGIEKEQLTYFTDSIANIYTYLQYHKFNSVIIYTALEGAKKLSALSGSNPVMYSSYENIAQLLGQKIVIEVKPNGDLDISIDYDVDINFLRENAIIYKFDGVSGDEMIYGKREFSKLLQIPDTDSYFAVRTYKTLELALEDYKTKFAKHSECPILKTAWFEKNMLFFKKAPEHILRDSLTHFLKKLRNAEVRPEQVVDKSHPVDIKVTWSLTNRLALIEIKWLGKSLIHRKKQFTKKFYEGRALEGAKQLADYLDANLRQSPTHATKGYLVVFDARRAACNSGLIEELSQNDAMKYSNSEITYDPDYSSTRDDFSRPYRFFLQPNYTT